MSVSKPFRRTCRQFIDGGYSGGGRWMYILHPAYARQPEHYIRAFLLLQKDLSELFDYLEPADVNLPCYSYRIHEILLRAAIEVEANCKAILAENCYARNGDWNMGDYRKVNASHRLSSYSVRIPVWNGAHAVRQPFAAWATGAALPWYTAYNATKHDRHSSFQRATFENMLDAVCGLVVILSAQFYNSDFGPTGSVETCGDGPNDGMVSAIGGFFRIKFANDFPMADRYDFDWPTLANVADPFANFTYI